MVVPPEQRGFRPGRATAVFGGIAIVVIAVAAIVVTVLRDEQSGETLYVLPVPAVDWQLTNGALTDPADDAPATAEHFITSGRLYGVADDDGYVDLRSTALYADSPLSGAEWTSGFEASDLRRVDDSITLAREAPDGTWRVASSPDDLLHVNDVIVGGTPLNVTAIAAFTPTSQPAGVTTSFDMTAPDGATFTVETSVSASPLFDAATFAERIEPVDVNGTSGWVLTDERDDGTATVVTWSPESERVVTVSSIDEPEAAVVGAARSLQPVNADEWTAAFPDAPAD